MLLVVPYVDLTDKPPRRRSPRRMRQCCCCGLRQRARLWFQCRRCGAFIASYTRTFTITLEELRATAAEVFTTLDPADLFR